MNRHILWPLAIHVVVHTALECNMTKMQQLIGELVSFMSDTTTREVDVARASPLARIWPEQLLLDCSNGRLVSTSMGNLWLVPPTQVGCRNNSV